MPNLSQTMHPDADRLVLQDMYKTSTQVHHDRTKPFVTSSPQAIVFRDAQQRGKVKTGVSSFQHTKDLSTPNPNCLVEDLRITASVIPQSFKHIPSGMQTETMQQFQPVLHKQAEGSKMREGHDRNFGPPVCQRERTGHLKTPGVDRGAYSTESKSQFVRHDTSYYADLDRCTVPQIFTYEKNNVNGVASMKPQYNKPVSTLNNVPQKEARTVIFVLGGPGSGKGTQCAKLVSRYGCVHYSSGDLLREESKKDTEQGRMISSFLKEGKLVPGDVTLSLLKNAIMEYPRQDAIFLIDGFPREMTQATEFEDRICKCQFVLFFDCPEDILEARLLERGKTSGRSDDNLESIKKRFKTFISQSMPVVNYFKQTGRVRTIDSSQDADSVFADVCNLFE